MKLAPFQKQLTDFRAKCCMVPFCYCMVCLICQLPFISSRSPLAQKSIVIRSADYKFCITSSVKYPVVPFLLPKRCSDYLFFTLITSQPMLNDN